MMKSLYIAATGMGAQQTNIDVISNNLANVNTNSFKKGRAEFQDLMYQELQGVGSTSGSGTTSPTGIMLGSGVKTASVGKVHTVGDFRNTSNQLDLAIEGKGFFQVTMPDGTAGYTRDGAFKLSSEGRLVNNKGYSLSPEITIPSNAIQLTIAPNGSVTAIVAGTTTPSDLGTIEIAGFANPAGLRSIGMNIYQETSSSGTPTSSTPGVDGIGTLLQGFLESSNVNIAEELVDMIVAQRAYELNSKAIQSSDEMLQLANSLKR